MFFFFKWVRISPEKPVFIDIIGTFIIVFENKAYIDEIRVREAKNFADHFIFVNKPCIANWEIGGPLALDRNLMGSRHFQHFPILGEFLSTTRHLMGFTFITPDPTPLMRSSLPLGRFTDYND